MKALWHSRLPDRISDPAFEALNSSVGVDARLFREEIAATKAHACALRRAGIYTNEECEMVRSALCRIEEEIAGGRIPLDEYEDIHTVVEARLTELTGEAGAKIQTSRSRNEQTQVAQRLFMRSSLRDVAGGIGALQKAAVDKAEENMDAVMPGFTHARPAQPIRFAHYLCALFTGLERDKGRLIDALGRMDACPSGSGALAGATFPLGRDELARELGFSGPTENSLDTVSDRDAQLETLSALAILMVRLSRLSEDLILWSSPAYGFLELGDAYCTSSSLMPQKKNPDALELVRGKTARVDGDLLRLLALLKGLPAGYQKDLQEDKEAVFDAADAAMGSVAVMAAVIAGLSLRRDTMRAAAAQEEMMAAGLAVALAREGMPFRKAHGIVGSLVAEAQKTGRSLRETAAAELKKLSPGVAGRLEALFDPLEAVRAKSLPGGTAPEAVQASLDAALAALGAD
jgi:argininosuccinate lyase